VTAAAERHLQVVAWAVLLGALVLFIVIVVGVPSLAIRYVRTATVEETAAVECKSGSCTLGRGQAMSLVLRAGDPTREVTEGWTVGTDANARALVRFVDGATVNLEPDTTIVVRRMRRARFAGGEVPQTVEVEVGRPPAGHVARLKVGATWGASDFVVRTPHGWLRLAPETHARVEIDGDVLRVNGTAGTVTLGGRGGSVDVGPSQRGEVRAGTAPSGPLPAMVNLVDNGEFDALPQARGWTFRVDVPGGATDPGRAYAATVDERTVVRIERRGSGGRPADIVYEQLLGDVDISQATAITVGVRLRVLAQSLPLGGMRGSELPAMVKLVGETASGEQVTWTVGFFAVRPAPDVPEGTFVLATGVVNVEVPLGQWTDFDSGNMLDADNANSFVRLGLPEPQRLTRVELIASGHDYASDVDAVAVWVR
jgi:hypothetical protein